MQQNNDYQLILPTSTGVYFFNPGQIVRMEAKSNYTNIYFTDRKPLLVAKVLKDYEEVLQDHGFIRTHRSHLVNSRYIVHVDAAGSIMMKDSSKAEMSRRKKCTIMRALKAAILSLVFLVVYGCVNAQNGSIGIGTTTPDSSAALDISSNNKGFLLPRLALTAANIWSLAGSKPTDGMMIYNSAYSGTGNNAISPGLYYWRGNQWFAVYQSTGLNYNGTDSVDCGLAGGQLTPQTNGFVNGQSYSGFISAPYKSGNGGNYPGEVITVKGITLTRSAGSLAQGNGIFLYTVSGTYSGTSGNSITFPLNLLGGSLCNVTLPIAPAAFIPGTLNCNLTGYNTGFFQAGLPTNSSNIKIVRISAATTGSFSITSSSASNNGVVFNASGLAIAGYNDIILTASGTPITSGTFNYIINLAGQICSFSIYYAPELNVDCSGVVQNTPGGMLQNGVPYSGTVIWNYTSGNGSYYIPAQSLGPINGLTLSRPSSVTALGSGSVTYTLSGTYTGPSGGEVIFPITLAGINCNAVYGDNIRNALNAGGCAHCAAYDAAFANTWVQVDSSEYNQLQNRVGGAFVAGAPEVTTPLSNCQVVGTGATSLANNARIPASSYLIGFSVANPTCNPVVYYRTHARVKTSPFLNSGFVNYGGYLPNDTINFVPVGQFFFTIDHTVSYYVIKTPGIVTWAGSTYLGFYDGGGVSPFNDDQSVSSYNSYQGTGDTNVLPTNNTHAWFKIQAITTVTKQW